VLGTGSRVFSLPGCSPLNSVIMATDLVLFTTSITKLSNAMHCMGQNIKSLAACVGVCLCEYVSVCVCVCARVLGPNTSKTAGEWRYSLRYNRAPMGMAFPVSNGHMTDDVSEALIMTSVCLGAR